MKSSSTSRDKTANHSTANDASANDTIANDRLPVCHVGCLFATEQEAVGLLDLLPDARFTTGNGIRYYETSCGPVQLVIALSGSGPKKATATAEALLSIFRPQWLLSAGFAAALQPELKKGQIIVPSQIIDLPTGQMLDLAPSELVAENSLGEANEAKLPPFYQHENPVLPDVRRFRRGSLLSNPKKIETKSEKKQLGQTFHAACLDRETWSVAQVCLLHNVPFLPIRAILDPLNQKRAGEAQVLAESQKSPARFAGAFLGALFKKPSAVLDLYQLKEDALTTSDTLARAIVSLLRPKSSITKT